MSRLSRYKHVWRGIAFALLLVALIGPWWFDLIDVPSQYPCSHPYVRLEGDFCGLPMSGLWTTLDFTRGLGYMVVELLTGTAVLTDRIREFSISLLILLPVLPIFSTFLMILGSHRRRRQMFHIIVLGLAICVALFMGANLVGTSRFAMVWWILWGIWLYLGVTVSALVLEVLTLNSENET